MFLVIYITGVIVATILIGMILREEVKDKGMITLGDTIMALAFISTSWVIVGVCSLFLLIALLRMINKIILWKRRTNKN